MVDRSEPISDYWSSMITTHAGKDFGLFWWNAGPEIVAYKNLRISGDASVNWIEYTLNEFLKDKLPLANCLSLGCGGGRLERKLAGLGAFGHCDAYDVAEGAIRKAREMASQRGFSHISYHLTDINQIELPADYYDSVWVTMAMHHFQELEHICAQIARALRPDGILVLNEYVGPNRFQFSERQKEVANLCLALLPSRYRVKVAHAAKRDLSKPTVRGIKWLVRRFADKVMDGDLLGALQRRLSYFRSSRAGAPPEKLVVNFPTVRDVIAVDPSESIRSEEIVGVIQDYFEIVQRRDWGGNLLQFLLKDIAGNFSLEDPHASAFLRMLINIEDTFLQCGEFDSDFTYIVARPRKV